jgi:ribonuclease P protein component
VFVLKSIDSTAIGADESGLPARIGIITPKKIGNAVWRNTIRRVIREAFRLNSQVFQRNRDYLVVAMRGITEKSNAEISEKIVNAATKMR